jgi:DNA repair exonuclease SbcCD nuclease subunit
MTDPDSPRATDLVVHCSDLHFGRGFQREPARMFAAQMQRIRPDAVVVSGDLTMRARPGQFREAAGFLRAVAAPTLIIPGNHDIPVFDLATRLVAPFCNYRRHIAPLSSNPVVLRHAALVGIDTVTRWRHQRGRLRADDLARAAEWMRGTTPARWRVAVVHQQFANLPGVDRPGTYPNAEAALGALSAAGAHAVLHGHIHVASARSSRDIFPSIARPVVVVSAGTPTCGRLRSADRRVFSFNLLEFGPRHFGVTAMDWDHDAGDFAPAAAARFARDFFGEAEP